MTGWIKYVGGLLLALVVGAVIGKCAVGKEIVVEEKEVVRTVLVEGQKIFVDRVIEREVRPDGTTIERIEEKDRSEISTTLAEDRARETKEEVREGLGSSRKKDWVVSVGSQGVFGDGNSYFIHIQRRILGELYLGGMGSVDDAGRFQGGVSIGIRF